MSRSVDRVARELLELKRQVRHISTQPQLAYSSVEGGYLLFNENDGTPGVVVGEQFDGTNTATSLTGPPPPTPTAPIGEPHLNAAKVTWDGLFIDDAIVPMDFSRIEIHAVEDPDDPCDVATGIVGTYETPRGGDAWIPMAGARYIKLVARSLSGARSVASAPSLLITPTTAADITADVGDIALDALNAANDAVTASASAQADAAAAQSAAAAAQSDATAAASAASTAQSTATSAAADAAAAAGIAGAKADVLIQSATPGSTYEAATTLWIDTTGGANTPKRWNGSSWAAVTDKAATDAASAAASAASAASAAQTTANNAATAAAAAQTTANNAATAASTAQSTADGKNKVTYSTASPGTNPNIIGDTWFRTDGAGHVIEHWQGNGGTSWTQRTLDNAVIANLDAGKVTTGVLAAARIGAHTITTDKLIIGSFDNLIADPMFATALGTSWQTGSGISINATASRAAGPTLRITNAASDQITFNLPLDQFRVDGQLIDATTGDITKQGDTFLLATWVKSSVADSGHIVMGARFKLANGTFQTAVVGEGFDIPAATWTQIYGQATAPQDAVSVSFYVETLAALATGTVDFDNPSATRAGTGELIVDGAIRGKHIAAESITTEHLAVGVLEAGFTLTGQLVVGNINVTPPDYGTGDPGGIVVTNQDGSITRITGDDSLGPSVFSGDIVSENVRIKDDLSVSGTAQIQGDLLAANGVTSPTFLPTVSQYWPSAVSSMGDGSTSVSDTFSGLTAHASDATKMVASKTVLSQPGLFVTTIEVIKKSDFTHDSTITLSGSWGNNFRSVGGIALVGTDYFLLGYDDNRFGDCYIYKIGSTGTKSAEFRLGGPGTFHDALGTSNPMAPRLVSNGTQVGMIWIPSDFHMYLRWYNPSTFATVGSDISLINSVGGYLDIGDAYYGDAHSGLGAGTLWVAMRKTTNGAYGNVMCWRSVTTTAATRDSTALGFDFPKADGQQVIGMHFDSTNGVNGRFLHVNNNGLMRTYSDLVSGTPLINAAYTFYDGDTGNYPLGTVINGVDVGGTASAVHETLPSGTASAAVARRAWFRIECTPAPEEKVTDSTRVDKANRIGLYFANNSTPKQYSYLAVGTRTLSGIDVMPTGSTVPVTNTFTSGASPAFISPGRFVSAATRLDGTPSVSIGGDGVANIDGLVPPGTIFMSASPRAPKGWLNCDGTAVSRTTYADLLRALTTVWTQSTTSGNNNLTVSTAVWNELTVGAIVEASNLPSGTFISSMPFSGSVVLSNGPTSTASVTMTAFPHGDGNGTTTFNLPDTRNRFPVGADNSNRGLGKNEGAAVQDRTPYHAHGISSDGSHTHNYNNASIATTTQTGGSANRMTGGGTTGSDGGHNHSGSTGSTGGFSGGSSQFPNYAVRMVIKT